LAVMLFLTKLLPPIFVYPLGAAILVSAVGLVLSFTAWRRVGQVLLAVALFSIWIAGTPIFANWLTYRLESEFPPVDIETLPQSSAVILLGGVLGQPFPPRLVPDLDDAADRIIHALRIYRAGKAPYILISAGTLPWERATVPEAQLIADLLVELGAPRSALMLDPESRTTRENAVNVAAIFREHGWQNGILVTSGAHMPRALAAFQKVGLSVTPASTDVHASSSSSITLFDLLPDAGALARTTSAIKEMLGFYVYRFQGWA